jgi:hypothetical protein
MGTAHPLAHPRATPKSLKPHRKDNMGQVHVLLQGNKNHHKSLQELQNQGHLLHKKHSRSFNTQFREHLRVFKYGYGKSIFAQHLLENGHAIGPMQDITDTLHFTKKGRLMDMIESFYIFCETVLNNQINNRLTAKPNTIFETIVLEDPHRGIHDTGNTQ